MPNKVAKLAELYRAGLDVYPPGMRGLAASGGRAPRAMTPPVKPAAAQKFIAWVRTAHPKLYAAAERRANAPRTLGALSKEEAKAGTTTTPGAFDRIVTAITSLAPQIVQARAQRDVLEVQLERMRQGLPPLSATQYAPGLQLSVDPSMYAPGLEAMKPWLIWGGLGLVGVFVVSQLAKRRR